MKKLLKYEDYLEIILNLNCNLFPEEKGENIKNFSKKIIILRS